MGWSYTATAGRTMDKIAEACKRTRVGTQDETTSNVFRVAGKRYFYEVERQDQTDGGIVGEIWQSYERDRQSFARRTGVFRIDGQGRFVRGPKLFREAADTTFPTGNGGQWG
jgi:hypothetical protein